MNGEHVEQAANGICPNTRYPIKRCRALGMCTCFGHAGEVCADGCGTILHAKTDWAQTTANHWTLDGRWRCSTCIDARYQHELDERAGTP